MARGTRNPALLPMAMTLVVQAPLVMWMRMPLLLAEMNGRISGRRRTETERAVIEKISAGVESAGKLQIGFAGLWSEMMIGLMSGSVTQPGQMTVWERNLTGALEPYARRVKGNAARLKRRKALP